MTAKVFRIGCLHRSAPPVRKPAARSGKEERSLHRPRIAVLGIEALLIFSVAGAVLRVPRPSAQAAEGPARPTTVDHRPSTSWPLQALTTEQERALKPGDGFSECPTCPEMVVIPGGAFLMGSAKGEGDRDEQGPNGQPLKVNILADYALARFVVTVKDYMTCVADNGCPPPVWREAGSSFNAVTGTDDHFRRLGSALTNDRHPIVGVSWSNARAYAAWLNAKLRLPAVGGYRLPTEAEWERAARGGKENLRYSWGDEFKAGSANAEGQSRDDHWQFTSPVGSFPQNPYGLYDVHGNVWQWVEDCYHLSYVGMPEVVAQTGSAWISACDASGRRVLRGGSWIDHPHVLRAADRGGSLPDMRYGYVGFRVARTIAR